MQEPSELVNLRFDFNDWPSIFLHKINMVSNLGLEFLVLLFEFRNQVLLLQHFQEVLLVVKLLQRLNTFVYIVLEPL